MPNRLKLIFLVISADSRIYRQLKQCWVQWSSLNNQYSSTFFVKGDPTSAGTRLVEDGVIVTSHSESLIPGVLNKTIDAMQFIQENNTFDFLIRTNLSSFWLNENHLQDYFSANIRQSNCYAGYVGQHQRQLFVSGAGIIMSPDVVSGIIAGKEKLKKDLPDDVALGQLVQEENIAPLTPLQKSRYDIISYHTYPDEKSIAAELDHIHDDNNLTHVRLKNPNRDADVILFRKMLERQHHHYSNKTYPLKHI